MLGKAKCKILKEIRQTIADENDIPYITRECTYQGDCSGSCPRCESELRYLENELEKRRRLGKSVAVTALCSGIALGIGACSPSDPLGQELAGAAEEWPVHDENVDEKDINEEYQELAGAPEAWPEEAGQTEESTETLQTKENAFEGLKSFANTFNTGAVYSGAQSCPLYTAEKDVLLKAVSTYHWNGGKGAVPGAIRIYDVTDGENTLLGTWDASARGGSGAENVFWDIFPELELKEGHTYHIIDSGADTWSTNEDSGYIGFIDLYTVEDAEDVPAGTFKPCGNHEHTDKAG